MGACHDFFREYVLPAIREWRENRTNQRLATTVAGELNSLVDYYWHAKRHELLMSSGCETLTAFRAHLTRENENIGLVRDLADSHKHFLLDRASRSITNADQLGVRQIGYGEAYGLCYGGGEVLSVQLDNGTLRYYDDIAEDVFTYWRRLLDSDEAPDTIFPDSS